MRTGLLRWGVGGGRVYLSGGQPGHSYRRRGCCCSCARLHVATTCYAPCRPFPTVVFARRHDDAVLACLRALLANDVPPALDGLGARRAQLPLHFGGLGLRSAQATRVTAHWGLLNREGLWGPGPVTATATRLSPALRGRRPEFRVEFAVVWLLRPTMAAVG